MIANRLKYVVTEGSYEDFLGFVSDVAIVDSVSCEILHEISAILLSMTHKITFPFPTIDICGTGGDSSNLKTTNISTASAFVLASMGVKVAKHGGRAVSSSSGSLDFLSALGIPEIEPNVSMEKFGICFLDARKYHPAFKHIVDFRKKYGKKTIFNMLGPLINPVNISHQMVGISFPNMVEYAKTLQKLGRIGAVVQSASMHDELVSFEENRIVFVNDLQSELKQEVIIPSDFGIPMMLDDSILGGTPQENAENILKFFENPHESTFFYTICLNCGVSAKIFGLVESIKDGIDFARAVILSGKVPNLIHDMRNLV